MGIFSFFRRKKPEIKELSFEAVEQWFDGQAQTKKEEIDKRLAELKQDFSEHISKIKSKVDILDGAELQNSSIPVRVKQIMEGNRHAYIQKVMNLLEDLEPFEGTEEFCEGFEISIAGFGKGTARSYAVLQEFFKNESRDIAEHIGKLNGNVKQIYSEHQKWKGIQGTIKHIKAIQQQMKEHQEIGKHIEDVKEQMLHTKSKIVEQEESLKSLETGEAFLQYEALVGKIQEAEHSIKIILFRKLSRFISACSFL